ncbi:MAG: cobalamin B12-binding domain-containing protein [Acidobacteria bacterium]|nr:cobalamin B12-binding domain-containing protein [Acidobacteriota bacterium]
MMRRRKLLLVEPPFFCLFHPRYSLDYYPLSLGALASYIRRETDWEVMVYNADFVPGALARSYRYLWTKGFDRYVRTLADADAAIWQDVRCRIAGHAPDVVGISSTTPAIGSASRVARLAKQINARTLVVLGGAHASATSDAGLGCEAIDLAVRGEGELTSVELLRAIATGGPIEAIAGIAYRRGGAIVHTAAREPLPDLDTLPFPHEDAPAVLHGFDQYPITAFRYVMTSRGCPFGCVFCGTRSVWGRRVRHRSAGSIVDQMLSLNRAGLRVFCFLDDSFGVDRARLRALCHAIRVGCPGVQWRCLMHASTIDDESVGWVKTAGCYAIEVGVESGNARVLAALGKGLSLETAAAACRAVRRAGVWNCRSTFSWACRGTPRRLSETRSGWPVVSGPTMCCTVSSRLIQEARRSPIAVARACLAKSTIPRGIFRSARPRSLLRPSRLTPSGRSSGVSGDCLTGALVCTSSGMWSAPTR